MTAEDLFSGSRLKIKRANKHISDLNDALDGFIQTDFYSLAVNKDVDTGKQVLRIKFLKPIPESVPLILGDAVHNLRTSLDFVASTIVRIANGTGDYVKFPIRETRQKVEGAIKGGEIQMAPPSVIAAIIDQIKPYRGGNDPLYGLHELDIADKHLFLVPVISLATIRGVDIDFGAVRMPITVIIGSDSEIRVESLPDRVLEVKNSGTATFKVIFGEGHPFQLEPVIQTLYQLSQLVSGCVDTIAQAYISLATHF